MENGKRVQTGNLVEILSQPDPGRGPMCRSQGVTLSGFRNSAAMQ